MMAYAYPGVDGRFTGGLTNPAQNPLLGAGAGLKRFTPKTPLRPGTGATTPQRTAPVINPNLSGHSNFPQPDPVGIWGGGSGPQGPQGPQSTVRDVSLRGGIGNTKGGASFVWDDTGYPDFEAGPEIPGAASAGEFVGANYTAYDPRRWTDQPDVDTRSLVDASRHFYEEDMAERMGAAARRFGAGGAIRSTGYADTLGEAERKMFADVNALGLKYDYDAAQSDANRSLQAFTDFERRRAAEAARRTGFDVGQADRRTGYNVGQQDRGDALAGRNYGYGADEARRRQAYEDLKYRYGG